MRAGRVAAAAVLGTLAFWAYTRTLLPGVDLGDTGGFQAAVLWPFTSARRAYPLYYALATPFVGTVSAANPARGLNLFSAVWAAVAVALLAGLVATIARSTIAGIVSGLLLAFSYTFWTQAVIAEVYSLHLALVCVCLCALLAFARRPSRITFAIFCAAYALSFGNHYSMILLFIPCTAFLLLVHPSPRELLRPSSIAMALAIAALGALQYSANFMSIVAAPDGPIGWSDRVASFWFDTTKADWRESMVLGVPASEVGNRLAMWVWDARQQFGIPGLTLALAGAIRLWWISRPWAIFVALAYAISTLFALTYNVGDTHVFFLPSHFFTALAAGVALAPFSRAPGDGASGSRLARGLWIASAAIALGYASWRGWDTWPAVDRHRDVRGEELVARVTFGLNEQRTLLVSGLNWEVENGLLYGARHEHRDVVWTRVADVLPHFPFLVSDNREIGRDIVLTSEAATAVTRAYGSLLPIVLDESMDRPSLAADAERIPGGAPYVLSLLTPPPDERIDEQDVEATLGRLTGNRAIKRTQARYQVIAGLAGAAPAFVQSADRPFRATVPLLGEPFLIRFDAWLPFDTFRRGGFGHVIHGHSTMLTIERGVSLAWLDRDGVSHYRYAAGLYAPRARFRIPAATPQLAGTILARPHLPDRARP